MDQAVVLAAPGAEANRGEVDAAALMDTSSDTDAAAVLTSTVHEGLSLLQTSCGSLDAYAAAIGLLGRYVRNVLAHPAESKFRTIKRTNAKFDSMVGRHAAARQLIRWCGFTEQGAPDEPAYVLPPSADLQPLAVLAEAIRQIEPIVTPPPPAPPPPPVASDGAASDGAADGCPVLTSTVAPPQTVSTSSLAAPPPNHSSAAPTEPTVQAPLLGSARRVPRTLTEAHVASLRAQKVAVRPELSLPRELVILRPGEGLVAPQPPVDLPEDFYELTEADLRGINLGGAAAGSGGGAGVPAMQTAAMRELDRLKQIKVYSHALVRVRLPGGVLVQAAYHPQEPVEHVLSLVLSCLDDRLSGRPAYLFTTPPRTVLDLSSSLVESGLTPAATAVLAWRSPLPDELAGLAPEAMLKVRPQPLTEPIGAAERALAHTPTRPHARRFAPLGRLPTHTSSLPPRARASSHEPCC